MHPPRVVFVTDDRGPQDLTTRRHIDSMVRRAIELRLDAVEAIRLASYNTAQYFRLYNRGAVAPGFVADLVVLDDLNLFQVESIYKDGALVAQVGKLVVEVPTAAFTGVTGTVHIGDIRESDFR